jgi:hypothetical protein
MPLLWKGTPPGAYAVSISCVPLTAGQTPVTWVTCPPTYYLGVFYAGFSGVARPLAEYYHIQVGSLADYKLHGLCLVVSFVLAQLTEYQTRPASSDRKIVKGLGRDRVARAYSLALALAAVTAMELVQGFMWSGNLTAIAVVAASTLFGDLLWIFYGKKQPAWQGTPTRRRSLRPPRRPRPKLV